MTFFKPFFAVGAMASLLGCAEASGALTQAVVEKTETATALVVVNTEFGPGFGSAFCIDGSGLFATDAHVVLPMEGRIQLVIHPGEKDQQVVNAHVVGADSSTDLAVIQAENAGNLTALSLGDSDKLFPTQEVTAFGYPFGDELTVEKNAYPSISVNLGKVTSLRKKDNGELYLVQLDAAVNPGNSGGPIIDDEGKVMGLVEAGVPGSGVNFAIPVARLKAMLAKPLVDVEPGAVKWSERSESQAFTVKVTTLKNSGMEYQVSLSIKLNEKDPAPRIFTGQTKKGQWTVNLVPVANTTAATETSSRTLTPYVIYSVALSRTGNTIGTVEGPIAFTGSPESDDIFSFLNGQVGNPVRRRGGRAGAAAPAKAPQSVETQEIGPVGNTKGGTPFRLGATNEAMPLGLHIMTAKVAGKTVIRGITVQWSEAQKGNLKNLISARAGYVIGGLNVDASATFLDALQIIFIKKNTDGTLDPKDTYTSDWVGFANAKPQVHTLGGKGEHIVGFTGVKSADNILTAIGLLQIPPPEPSVPGVKEPLAPEKSG
jgi:S1-C subfamily serine protease